MLYLTGMFITFYGAAREVTGSCSLVEATGQKILVDCGLYQGSPELEAKNKLPLPFNPAELNVVVVTHCHLDHVGRLPLLIKGGYAGNFYATPPTVELVKLVLEDAVGVMFHNHRRFGTPILYEISDIVEVMARFKGIPYGEELTVGEAHIFFHDAGHVFGSAFIEIQAESKKVVFSGDVGNVAVPILRDTAALPPELDGLVSESTYGDRFHEYVRDREHVIEQLVSEAIARGGVLLIPSFAIERTQELVYALNDLIDRHHQLPRVPIFLDSPMAIDAIKVFRRYHEYYDEQAERYFAAGDDLFDFPGLTLTYTREESMKINRVPGPKIIIAGAGMMNGGRVVHHAVRYLSDPRNTLLIIGYQSVGTLGRRILEGESPVEILGEWVEVKCQVKYISALSAHGDQEKLLNWIGGGSTTPKKVYLNHGDPASAEALAKILTNDLGIKTTIASSGLRMMV